MYSVLENSLYIKDCKTFYQLREKADGFNQNFNGANIIQDDIFRVIENYAKQREQPFELLRYPIKDTELCACTFIRGGRIFVMLNSNLPLGKQIFAIGHELYHVWCYIENDDPELMENGSILSSETLDEITNIQEEMEANAFSALLLVPADTLQQQIRIYNINTKNITVDDILMLMEIFAIPYKAMILRLFEESLITEKQLKMLFQISSEKIHAQVEKTGKAARWNAPTPNIVKFGNLVDYLLMNEELDALVPSRLSSDKERIYKLQEKFKAK